MMDKWQADDTISAGEEFRGTAISGAARVIPVVLLFDLFVVFLILRACGVV